MKTKRLITKILTIALAVFLGVFIMSLIRSILLQIIIGDPETHSIGAMKTGPVFDLFYVMTAGNGYYPEPTIFNDVLTTLFGVALGLLVFLKWSKIKYRLLNFFK